VSGHHGHDDHHGRHDDGHLGRHDDRHDHHDDHDDGHHSHRDGVRVALDGTLEQIVAPALAGLGNVMGVLTFAGRASAAYVAAWKGYPLKRMSDADVHGRMSLGGQPEMASRALALYCQEINEL
jgi:hypothetical protein